MKFVEIIAIISFLLLISGLGGLAVYYDAQCNPDNAFDCGTIVYQDQDEVCRRTDGVVVCYDRDGREVCRYAIHHGFGSVTYHGCEETARRAP